MTHYERLGVAADATPDEIREAYRRLARMHHPDARGGAPSAEMPEINAAWRALSDPGRRAMYDAGLRLVDDPGSVRPQRVAPRTGPVDSGPPPRFPFRLVAGFVAVMMLLAFVVSGIADGGTGGDEPVDPIMRVGDCVVIEANGDARKVACADANDGVVEQFVPFDGVCASGTEPHRDRQGMGIACVVPAVG